MKKRSHMFVKFDTGFRKLRNPRSFEESACRIRKARISDLPELNQLELLCFNSDRFSPRQYRYLIESAHSVVAVYERDGHIVGCVILLLRKNSDRAHLYNLSVHPHARREGIGKELLSWAVRQAKNRWRKWLTLEVKVSNKPAIVLYRQFGFETIQRLPEYYEDRADAFRMVAPVNT